MKQLLMVVLAIALTLSCVSGQKVSGTADDTNNGSLFGKLLIGGKPIIDSATICLYNKDSTSGLAKATGNGTNPLRSIVSRDGSYRFDSLAKGLYRIKVLRAGIVIGDKRSIQLNSGANVEVNITVVVVVNQTFNIWTDQKQNITINNFYIDNGKVEKSDSGYVLSFARTDTVMLKMSIDKDGYSRTITVRVVLKPDGSTVFESIDAPPDISVKPGTHGYVGKFSVTIQTPGTIRVDAVFDTSSAPKSGK
jgi:hypothetical protein